MKISFLHIIGLFCLLLVFLGSKTQLAIYQSQEKPCCTEQSFSNAESQDLSCSTIGPIATDGEHAHCTKNCTKICHCTISQISLFPNALKPIDFHIGLQEANFVYFEEHPTITSSTIWNPPKKA